MDTSLRSPVRIHPGTLGKNTGGLDKRLEVAGLRLWNGLYDGNLLLDNLVRTKVVSPPKPAKAPKGQNISLTQIDGRHWLAGSNGQPFFAHGITHVGNNRGSSSSQSPKNATNWGSMPTAMVAPTTALRYAVLGKLEPSRPHFLLPGEKRGEVCRHLRPPVQSKLEDGVETNCLRSRDNPNAIGYCCIDLGFYPDNPSGKNWVDYIRSFLQTPLVRRLTKFQPNGKGATAKRATSPSSA